MESPRLNPAQAAYFISRLGEHLDFNINIMDRDGVIIASRDQARVGSFHEAARRLIVSGRAVESIHPDDPMPVGVKPGVNLPIIYKGETIGVVGLTGDPAKVSALAYAVKTSVETMVELELYKERMLRRQVKKNMLLNILLYEDEMPHAATESLARNLGYDARIPRAPILIRPHGKVDASEILRVIKSNPLHGSDDISAMTPDGAVLIFKSLNLTSDGPIVAFESQITSYVKTTLEAPGAGNARKSDPRGSAPAWVEKVSCYVGMFQLGFAHYRGAYHQVLWLAESHPAPLEPVLFLHQRLTEYLASRVPRADFVDTFAPLASFLPADFAAGLAASIDALFESAFNGKEAAARLGVHRNTLAARIGRLREFLGRDPRYDPRARELALYLVRYLEIVKRKA